MNATLFAYGEGHFDSMHVIALGPQTANPQRGVTLIQTRAQWAFPELRRACCTSEQATQIIEAWNSLPAGEQARCHTPGFAIELFQGSESVFIAALCWHCNNISIGGARATTDWRTFEARSDAGSRLLKLCRHITPDG